MDTNQYNAEINELIESVPYMAHQLETTGYTSANMADYGYLELLGLGVRSYFTDVPFGETDKYIWETVKVDHLKNLKICKK